VPLAPLTSCTTRCGMRFDVQGGCGDGRYGEPSSWRVEFETLADADREAAVVTAPGTARRATQPARGRRGRGGGHGHPLLRRATDTAASGSQAPRGVRSRAGLAVLNRRFGRAEDGRLHQFRGLARAEIEHVRVNLVGGAPAGVAKSALHDVLRHASIGASRSRGVPSVVQGDHRHPGGNTRSLPLLRQVPRVIRLAILAAEQVAAILIQLVRGFLLRVLTHQVITQHGHRGRSDSHRALALALGCLLDGAVAGGGGALPVHLQDTAVQVHPVPLEPEQLAAA
jgi:hypothetical protein